MTERVPVEEAGAPDWVAIFPRLAWRALQEKEVRDFVTWSVLRQHCVNRHDGAGLIAADDARSVIHGWRPIIDARSVRRLIEKGAAGGYWTRGVVRGEPHIWLASAGRLLIRFGLETPGVPHLVRSGSMARPAEMRARLYATTRQLPGHTGRFTGGLVSRLTVGDLTGLSPRTQQRYDNRHGATTLVQECHALVEGHEGPPLFGEGYYGDSRGQQWKRLPDLRTPSQHMRGSKSAARHAATQAKQVRRGWGDSGASEDGASVLRTGGNDLQAHPEYPQPTYYFATDEETARQRLRKQCAYCGHHTTGTCPHVQGTIGFGEPGRIAFRILGRR